MPLHQLYVEAPVAVIVVEAPGQIAAGEDEMLTVGFGIAFTVMFAVFEHPFNVPVTV